MKKIVCLILVFLLAFGVVATAESVVNIDLSAMSEDALRELIDAARLELTKYNPIVADGTVLYEDEGITITYTGEMYTEYGSLYVKVILENRTDSNIIIGFDNASCNGWGIMGGTLSAPAHKKVKDEIDFTGAVEDAELSGAEDVEDIECTIHYFDEDTFDTLAETDGTIVWNFN